MQTVSQYEVRCPRCDVSFPPETRRCMHCGARTGPSTVEIPDAIGASRSPAGLPTMEPIVQAQPGEYALEDEPEAPGRSILRSMGSLLWIALLIGFSILRACGDEG